VPIADNLAEVQQPSKGRRRAISRLHLHHR